MASKSTRLNTVLNLPFRQGEVGFVIPDLARDVEVGIDPFLLFKSRDSGLRKAHDRVLEVFNSAISMYSSGRVDEASEIIDFPEVSEIGFGYTKKGSRGSGLGTFLNSLILETLAASPQLVRRGVRHVEEMQLVSLGIGPDRVSDIAGNVLKAFLIEYTQQQAELWGIPVQKDVPVHHVFDFGRWTWEDGYYDLPVNPLSGSRSPIILVPRRIVRALPWINFGDYQKLEFTTFLRAKHVRGAQKTPSTKKALPKSEVVVISRREVERIDHYVARKEREAARATPTDVGSWDDVFRGETDRLKQELLQLPSGTAQAVAYQDLLLRIFNVLFEPDLIEGQPQSRTDAGSEIRDIIFTNDSDKPFLDFLRNHHGNLSVVFELKNKTKIDGDDLNQLAGYLGDALGYSGFLVSRNAWTDANRLKAGAIYNKGNPRRVLIHLSDADLVRMLDLKCAGKDPVVVLRQAYQDFVARLQ